MDGARLVMNRAIIALPADLWSELASDWEWLPARLPIPDAVSTIVLNSDGAVPDVVVFALIEGHPYWRDVS